MIHTNRIVTVGEQECIIDRPIVLYRGDREVEIEFTLLGNEFRFSDDGNVIKSSNASHGQLVLNTPSGENMFSEVSKCHDGNVVFIITKEMIDEFIEVGFYNFQIRLYDGVEMKSRMTIPPVLNGIDIRNPIAAEDEANVVDQGIVDYARIFKDQYNEELPTFDWTGAYNKTEWMHHDVITENKMNKIEDALYSINANVKESDVVMLNTLDQIKKDTDAYIKEHMAEVEVDVDEFERNLNTDVQQFKIDTNAAMTAHKNEVGEVVDGFGGELENVNSQLAHKANLNEIYITDFGAIGDGVSDDTIAIQNAINSSNNCAVVFPKGVYIVSQLVLKSDIKLIGNKAILKTKNNADSDESSATMLLLSDISNIDIENLEFDGNKDNQISEDTDIHSFRCIKITNCKNINIKNNYFHDFKHKAIDVFSNDNQYTSVGVEGLNIIGNIFKDVWSACTITESSSKDILFSNNNIENCQEHGFTTYPGCSYVRVIGNSFKNIGLRTMDQAPADGLYNYGSGIRLLETKHGVISDNIIENPRFYGIRVTTNTPLSFQTSEYVTINNNIVYGGERLGDCGNGIELLGNNIICSSNIIKDFKSMTTSSGILINGNKITVTNNSIENVEQNGILGYGSELNISQNTVNDAVKYGIQCGGTNSLSKSNISNNIISSNTTTERGIYVQTNATELYLVGNNFNNVTNIIVNYGGQILFIDGAYYSASIPTTGTYRKGDRIRNSNLKSGEPIGWICTHAGSPGTWIPESILS